MSKIKFFILFTLLVLLGCSKNNEINALIGTDGVNNEIETPQFTKVSATPAKITDVNTPETTATITDLPSGQILFYSSTTGDIGLFTLTKWRR